MKLITMASVSISSSPACSMKLQQLSSSSLLSSPNTSSSSSTTTLSPTSSSSNPNNTTPTHYNSHSLHSHHQIQLAHIQQHIAQKQQQSHHINSNNNLNIASVGAGVPSLNIKKEPGLISPPGIHTGFGTASTINNNNNSSSIKNTMVINANCNNNSPMNTANMTANNHVSSSTTISSSNANSNVNFCSNNNLVNAANSKCKRKINFSHLGIPTRGHQPATVARRNARERNRVKQVNNGFQALKQHIPLGHRSKKMSKVETLRCAVDYIKNLKSLLDPNGLLTSDDGTSAFDQLQFDFGMGSGSGGSTQQMSPTSSEDPSSPSYASEGSYVVSTGQPGNNSSNNNGLYDYENYEPVSPEDEELLDAISWWQQS